MSRLSMIPLIWLLLVSLTAAAEPTIHVVIAADGRAGFGQNLVADRENMERVFRQHVPKSQLDIVLMDVKAITPDSLLAAVAKLEIEKEDTLVVYYSGHGANDDRNGGHYFQLKDDDGKTAELQRRTLLAKMKEKQARLCVLLTDCCNLLDRSSGNSKNATTTSSPKKMSPLFEGLFLKAEGVVDITSSKLGEASFLDTTTKKRGSCFTYPLVELFEKYRDDDKMSWPKFVDELRTNVKKAFSESWPDGYKIEQSGSGSFVQKTQTVEVYGKLPGEESSGDSLLQGPRFGVRAVNRQGGGVRITEVVSRSPGQRAGFEVGDVIVEINGQKVADEKDYSDLIDKSPKNCEIKLINVNDGKTILVKFELRD